MNTLSGEELSPHEQALICNPGVYRCKIEEWVNVSCGYFSLSVPPGEMLVIADFLVTHRERLEQLQRELDIQHEALIQEIKLYCAAHEKPFHTLSDWDITDLLRELGGCIGTPEGWKPVECLSLAGRWYRTTCCDETGSIYSHIWEPFYAVFQQWQRSEEAIQEPR